MMDYRIAALGFPDDEQPFGKAVEDNLIRLDMYCQRFRHTLSLFDTCYAERAKLRQKTEAPGPYPPQYDTFITWELIAGRDGAMTIWDFARATHLVSKNLEKCPTLAMLVDRPRYEKCLAQFQQDFPNAKIIRHAVAHPSDLYGAPKDAASNSFTGEFNAHGIEIDANDANTVFDGISGRQVLVTIYGQIVGYELSDDSVQKMQHVRDEIHKVFAPAGKATMEAFIKKLDAGEIEGVPPKARRNAK